MEYEFVFDLDDTLYAERDYVISGFNFLTRLVSDLYRVQIDLNELIELYDSGEKTPINTILNRFEFSESTITQIVASMRGHIPDISIRNDALIVINKIRSLQLGFSIVTDGRSITQRSKLYALNLLDAKGIYVSEEVGVSKLNPYSFSKIQTDKSSQSCIYVGDNPRKDFLVPNELGWNTVMVLAGKSNVHSQDVSLEKRYRPKHRIKNFEELCTLFDLE